MENKHIARELVRIARVLLADDVDYYYDPEHKKRPSGGGWRKTDKGWSKADVKQTDKKTVEREPKIKNEPVRDYIEYAEWVSNLPESEKVNYGEEISRLQGIKDAIKKFSDSVHIGGYYGSRTLQDKLDWAEYEQGDGSSVLQFLEDDKIYEQPTCQRVFKRMAKELAQGKRKFTDDELTKKFMGVVHRVKSDYADFRYIDDKDERESHYENAAWILGIRSLTPKYNPYITMGTIGYQQPKEPTTPTIDLSKLSPELRQKVKDWDIEDIKRFLGWLRKNKGFSMPGVPGEEQQM